MLLEQVMHYNDLSPQLRDELTTKIKSFGKVVRYRFEISHPNPDPTQYNGTTIWPHLYVLDPAVFTINDPYEKRDGKQKAKRIGLVDAVDEQGRPNKFRKIKILGSGKGILTLHLDEGNEDFYNAMFLELHPKLTNGKFSDKSKQQVIVRIDEAATAKEERKIRSARKLAMDTAEKMSNADVEEFSDAMGWLNEGPDVLRNKIEALAETSPDMFNDLVNDKRLKYQSSIKRGMDNKVFNYDPSEGKLVWSTTGITICSLGFNNTSKSELERLAEWFMTSGINADNAYKKLNSLLKKETIEKV